MYVSESYLLYKRNSKLDKVVTAVDELHYWACNGNEDQIEVLDSTRVIENYLGIRQ